MVNLAWIMGFCKNKGGLMVENLKYNEVKCKKSLLEVSGYWIWALKVIERFSGPFPPIGEDDL